MHPGRPRVDEAGLLLFLAISAVAVLGAGPRDQELVLFYAVSVFMTFFVGPKFEHTALVLTTSGSVPGTPVGVRRRS